MDCIPVLFLLISPPYVLSFPYRSACGGSLHKAKTKAGEVPRQIVLMTILRGAACLFGWHIMRLENE